MRLVCSQAVSLYMWKVWCVYVCIFNRAVQPRGHRAGSTRATRIAATPAEHAIGLPRQVWGYGSGNHHETHLVYGSLGPNLVHLSPPVCSPRAPAQWEYHRTRTRGRAWRANLPRLSLSLAAYPPLLFSSPPSARPAASASRSPSRPRLARLARLQAHGDAIQF